MLVCPYKAKQNLSGKMEICKSLFFNFLENLKILLTIAFILFTAKFSLLEKDEKHSNLVTIYTTVQETSISMDTISWSPR